MDPVQQWTSSKEIAERADAARLAGETDQARHLAETALGKKDETSRDGWHVALRCLGTMAWARADPATACVWYEKALEHCRSQTPLSPSGLIAALDDLAIAYYFLGENGKALDLRREALEIASAQPCIQPDVLRRLKRRLAQSYQRAGAIDAAETLYHACRPSAEDSVEDQLGWHNAMALLCEDKGEIATAAEWFEQVVDIIDRTEGAQGLAQALGNAIETRLELGDVADVARMLRRLHSVCRIDRKLSARLGLFDVRTELLASRSRYVAAAKVALRANTLLREAHGGRSVPPGRIAFCAVLVKAAGRPGEARELLETNLPAAMDTDAQAVPLLVELAAHRLESAEIKAARDLLCRALELETGSPGLEGKWLVFSALADFAHDQGKARAAAFFGKIAIANLRATTHGLPGILLDGWMKARIASYDRLLNRLTMAGRLPEALSLKWRRSQEIARELAARRGAFDDEVGDVPFRPGEARLWRRYCDLQVSMRPALKGGHIADVQMGTRPSVRQWLADVLSERFDLTPALRRRRPIPFLPPADAQPLLSFLPDGNGLRGVLGSDGEEGSFRVKATAETMASDIQRLSHALRGGADRDWYDPARSLYDALIAPIAPRLLASPRLDIAISGMMGFVPFAALYDGQSFLVEKTAIALVTGQARPARKLKLSAQWRSAAFANTADNELPGAVAEARNVVARTMGKAFIDADFTVDALQAALKDRTQLLHIATHFDYVPGNPHRSALLLGDGKRLSLSELAGPQFDFSAVELLVLSGCETGISDTLDLGIEGLAGLLQAKGARHVVATLWRVGDEHAVMLMSKFYEALLAVEEFDPITALAKAQVEMLRMADEGPIAKARGGGIGGNGKPSHSIAAMPGAWAGFAAFAAQPSDSRRQQRQSRQLPSRSVKSRRPTPGLR